MQEKEESKCKPYRGRTKESKNNLVRNRAKIAINKSESKPDTLASITARSVEVVGTLNHKQVKVCPSCGVQYTWRPLTYYWIPSEVRYSLATG